MTGSVAWSVINRYCPKDRAKEIVLSHLRVEAAVVTDEAKFRLFQKGFGAILSKIVSLYSLDPYQVLEIIEELAQEDYELRDGIHIVSVPLYSTGAYVPLDHLPTVIEYRYSNAGEDKNG